MAKEWNEMKNIRHLMNERLVGNLWNLSLMSVVLYTLLIWQLPCFYHESGYHKPMAGIRSLVVMFCTWTLGGGRWSVPSSLVNTGEEGQEAATSLYMWGGFSKVSAKGLVEAASCALSRGICEPILLVTKLRVAGAPFWVANPERKTRARVW